MIFLFRYIRGLAICDTKEHGGMITDGGINKVIKVWWLDKEQSLVISKSPGWGSKGKTDTDTSQNCDEPLLATTLGDVEKQSDEKGLAWRLMS